MNLINLGTQELIDLHTPEAKAELERRVSKNGRKNAVKALQNWDGEGVGATIAVNGVVEAPQAGTREEAIKALLAELGVELPDAVQVPAPAKPKAKRKNTERIGGVNIQRTVDDNVFLVPIFPNIGRPRFDHHQARSRGGEVVVIGLKALAEVNLMESNAVGHRQHSTP